MRIVLGEVSDHALGIEILFGEGDTLLEPTAVIEIYEEVFGKTALATTMYILQVKGRRPPFIR